MTRSASINSPVIKVLVFVCLITFDFYFVESRTSPQLKVQLSHGGILVGRHLPTFKGRSMRAFLGVPYAQPPIGDLRFREPKPFGSWKGERLAIKNSEICTQRDPFRRDMEIEGSEDCLYLNVYTPEEPQSSTPLPVMVWFHGGGWECGSGVSSFYGPDFLLDQDIILVSANFRLGPLGFLSTETLDCPGNNGLKDQVEVLQWVQKNIAAFGGNPDSVTIFGESAGGASVTYHMASEKSKGLFHKGISQSGTYFNPWAQPAHKGVPAKRTRKVAEIVGCDHKNSNWQVILDCLRTKPANDVVATVYDLFEWETDPMIPFPPVVEPKHEGAFLTALPRTINKPYGFSLPLMIGVTADEGLLRTAAIINTPDMLEDFKKNFDRVLPIILNYDHHPIEVQTEITNKIKSFYLEEGHNYNKENHQNITDIISDGWFVAGIDEYIRQRLAYKESAPTHVYFYDHKGAASLTEIFKGGEDFYGACHADELQYLFPLGRELFLTAAPTKLDLELREAMTKMWANFATNSDPTPPGSSLVSWKPTESYPVSYMRIGSRVDDVKTPLLQNDFAILEQRVNFWKDLSPHLPAKTSHQEL